MDTTDFIQILMAQRQAEEAVAVGTTVGLVIAALLGALAGMAPLIYGAVKRDFTLAFSGFFCCVLAGLFGSLFLAGPVAAGFVAWIASHGRREATPPSSASIGASHPPGAAQILRAEDTGEMTSQHFERSGTDRVKFIGTGGLLQLVDHKWQYIGNVPCEVTLPEDGHPVTYKIRAFSGAEYQGHFARQKLEETNQENAAPIDTDHNLGAISIDRLLKLKSLLESGDITSEEFNRLKRQLLSAST